jgi:endoglucanase
MKFQVSLLCVFYLISQNISAQDYPTGIRLDQEGFYPKAPKVAILTGKFDKSSGFLLDKTAFYVICEKNSDTVFRGELSAIRKSNNSSLQTRTADFSSLTQTGLYRVSIGGCCSSFLFEIRDKVHRPVAVASLKAFYFQRASICRKMESCSRTS